MYRRLLPGIALMVVLVFVSGQMEGEVIQGTSRGLRKRPAYSQHNGEEEQWISTNEGTTMQQDEQEFVDAMNLAESAVLDSMELLYAALFPSHDLLDELI